MARDIHTHFAEESQNHELFRGIEASGKLVEITHGRADRLDDLGRCRVAQNLLLITAVASDADAVVIAFALIAKSLKLASLGFGGLIADGSRTGATSPHRARCFRL